MRSRVFSQTAKVDFPPPPNKNLMKRMETRSVKRQRLCISGFSQIRDVMFVVIKFLEFNLAQWKILGLVCRSWQLESVKWSSRLNARITTDICPRLNRMIFCVPNLQKLNLQRTNITNDGVQLLNQFPNLTCLNLSFCHSINRSDSLVLPSTLSCLQFKSVGPIIFVGTEDFPPQFLPKLSCLNVEEMPLARAANIFTWIRLRRLLKFRCGQIDALPQREFSSMHSLALGPCPKPILGALISKIPLQELSLSRNCHLWSSTLFISCRLSLRKLHCTMRTKEDADAICGLTNLTKMEISFISTSVLLVFPDFSCLKRLRSLYMRSTIDIEFSNLNKLIHLTDLSMEISRFTFDLHLPNLRRLEILTRATSGADIYRQLTNMPSKNKLLVFATRLDNTISHKEWLEFFPKLTFLHFFSNTASSTKRIQHKHHTCRMMISSAKFGFVDHYLFCNGHN